MPDDKELRYKIAEIINNARHSNLHTSCFVEADSILSLLDYAPSGLQAHRECDWVAHGAKGINDNECPSCKGTGFITRDLTRKEAIEILKAWAHPDAEREYYFSQDDGSIYMMHNGERVTVKEG